MRHNPESNCFGTCKLFSVDEVTTGAWSFVLVIANVLTPIESVIKQFADHVNMKFLLQLTGGISRAL